MKRLWQVEWLKLQSYRTFWVFVGIFMLSTLIVYWTFDKFIQFGPANLAQVYQFPVAWYFVSYVSSWFTPFLTLLMITLVSNEISFRTLRQHVTDGMSPQEFLASKVILAIVISFGAMLFTFLTGLIIGITKGDLASSQNSFSMLDYLLRVFWNSFGLICAGIMLALLLKRSAISIMVFLAWYWLVEPILGRAWLHSAYAYFPLNSLEEFVPSPFNSDPPSFGIKYTSLSETLVALVYPFIFLGLSLRILKTRDL